MPPKTGTGGTSFTKNIRLVSPKDEATNFESTSEVSAVRYSISVCGANTVFQHAPDRGTPSLDTDGRLIFRGARTTFDQNVRVSAADISAGGRVHTSDVVRIENKTGSAGGAFDFEVATTAAQSAPGFAEVSGFRDFIRVNVCGRVAAIPVVSASF